MYLEYFSHRSDITEPKLSLPKSEDFTIEHKLFNFMQLLMRTVVRDFGRTGLAYCNPAPSGHWGSRGICEL